MTKYIKSNLTQSLPSNILGVGLIRSNPSHFIVYTADKQLHYGRFFITVNGSVAASEISPFPISNVLATNILVIGFIPNSKLSK